MQAKNADWLDLVQEQALEPELPICDPHHHFWDRRDVMVQPRYLLDEILTDLGGGHRVVSTVYVECGAMYRREGTPPTRVVGETEFVNGLAAMAASGLYGETQIAAAIVGTAPLDEGDGVAATLDAQIAASPARFRGIRHVVAWDESPETPVARAAPPPGLMASDAFRAGFRHLAPRGLTFDLWCYHPQLSEAVTLVRAFPDQTVILDHFGGPLGVGPYANRADEVFDDWRERMVELAQCPNVVAKLGGINMEVNGFGWHSRSRPPYSWELMEATRRYYETMIELFGVDRCMFESNFPVDKVSCSYTVLWNSFKRLVAHYSEDEKRALFHDTATRIYRIQPSGTPSD